MQVERLSVSGQGLYQKAINVDAAHDRAKDENDLWANLGCGVAVKCRLLLCHRSFPSYPSWDIPHF